MYHSPVRFADATTGWTTATTTDAPVQITSDGGTSWRETTTLPSIAATVDNLLVTAAANLGATLTTSLENGTGWAFVERGLCSGTKEGAGEIMMAAPFDCIQYHALLSTPDGGATWLDIMPTLK